MKEEAPNYVINLISKCGQNIQTRNYHITTYHCQKDCFKHSFFPSTFNDWFNLDDTIGNSESLSILKKRLLSFICPIQINVHNIFDPKGLEFLTRLGLSFSHLNEHRFLYNFQDCLNSLHSHSLEIEDWSYELCVNIKKDLLLHCDSYLHRNKKKYFGDNSNIL